jgi:tetratricopeptide (TPR) repeat protein
MDDTNAMQSGDTAGQDGMQARQESAEAQEWTDKGNQAAEQGDYEEAVEAFERAVDMNPTDARARYNLALAQQYLGDSESAIAGYQR